MRSPQCSISGTALSDVLQSAKHRGQDYLLRNDEETDEWTLQSGFDGDELLVRPSIQLITVDADVIRRAEKEIESCEHCHPDDAEIPFDWLLAEVNWQTRTIRVHVERTDTLSEL